MLQAYLLIPITLFVIAANSRVEINYPTDHRSIYQNDTLTKPEPSRSQLNLLRFYRSSGILRIAFKEPLSGNVFKNTATYNVNNTFWVCR